MANFNFNKIIIGGRLTKDIEIKTKGDKNIGLFSIATSNSKKETTFFDCIAFDKKADFIGKYFKKGSSICVVGEINDYKKNDKTYKNVTVSDVYFVDAKNDTSENSENDDLPF